MNRIVKPTLADLAELTKLARNTMYQSHGTAAPAEDMDIYIAENFTEAVFQAQLSNPEFHYNLFYDGDVLAGYSKIIFNQGVPAIPQKNVAKLERLYFDEAFLGKGFAQELMDYNTALAKENGQAGLWLFVWVGNHRAIQFYEKSGFEIVGSHDFRVSARHSNPNHQMYLGF